MSLYLESYAKESLEQTEKLPTQASAFLGKFILKQMENKGSEDYYANITALIAYPRYLFREDMQQKWTNERTKDNICIIPCEYAPGVCTPIGKISKYFIYQFDSKSQLFNSLIDWQSRIFQIKNDSDIFQMKKAKDRIRFFNMEIKGEITEQITEDIVSVLRAIDKSDYNMNSFCAVLHQDEDKPHVHFIYHLDQSNSLGKGELKKIPHIDNVIRGDYNDTEGKTE